jgi:hypothetical protein
VVGRGALPGDAHQVQAPGIVMVLLDDERGLLLHAQQVKIGRENIT